MTDTVLLLLIVSLLHTKKFVAPTFKHKVNSIINSYVQDFPVLVVSLICGGMPEDAYPYIKVIVSQDVVEL